MRLERSFRSFELWFAVACFAACGGAEGEGPAEETAGILSLGTDEGPGDGSGEGADATQGGPGPVDSGEDTEGATSGNDDGPKFDLPPPADVPAGEDCVGLTATIRDFQISHPDFEAYGGNQAYVGLVQPLIGGDNTPQFDPTYAGTPMITSAASFSDWYHDVAGTNMAFPIALPLTEMGNGEFVFDSNAFFPLDGMGFGNEDNPHNYHFTTEVHTSFTYHGGEVFTFRGDDDVWMFVNGELALDLGGLHSVLEGTAVMDDLGLTVGQTYPMDIFHAERHTTESNFRIVTTIDCFEPPAG